MTAKAVPLPRPDLPDYDHFASYLTGILGKATRTAKTYADHSRLFTDWLTRTRPDRALAKVTRRDVEDYIIDLDRSGIAQSTRRVTLYALRAFYDYLLREDPEPVNPARQLRPPAQSKTKTTDYSDPELVRLLDAAWQAAEDAKARGLQCRWVRSRFDHAVLATFRYTGVRLAELCSIETGHVNLVRRQLEVVGKGSQQRHIPIPVPLARILHAYLTDIRPLCPASDRLFANPSGYAGTGAYGKLTHRATFAIVVKYGELAGLAGPNHPHRCRHGYATDLLRRGVDLETISKLLGHADIATTIRYLHLDTTDRDRAIDRAFGLDDENDTDLQAAAA